MKTFVKRVLQKILGLKTYLYIFARFVIFKLRWDKKENDFFHFLKMIPPKGIILDLGANIGATSYHLAKNFPQSKIFSFEPLSLNMNTLKRIKQHFNLQNITEIELAVGNKNGTIEMLMPVVNKVPMHGLSHVNNQENPGLDKGFEYKVEVVKIDDYKPLAQQNINITAIKIDVENYEYQALLGAEKLIEKHKPTIYTELWDNDNRKKCVTFLNKLGYSAFVLYKKKLVPFQQSPVEKHNFFFIPD
jgi:FkbM family methyltransferase